MYSRAKKFDDAGAINSVFQLLLLLVIVVFSVELAIMLVLRCLAPAPPPFVEALVDGVALCILACPLLYFCCFRPLRKEIAERKRAEEKVRASEGIHRSVVEDLTEIIARFKPDGTLVFVNDVFCRLFGLSKEELLSKGWQPVAFPEDVPHVESKLRTLSPANPVVVIENRVYAGNGEVRWMQFVNRGIFDNQGALIEIQAVGRDITERKRQADLLKQQTEEREKLIAELQKALGEVKTLSGLIPVCAKCKRTRNDKGYWEQLEQYISSHSQARFTHGLCPECAKSFYGLSGADQSPKAL